MADSVGHVFAKLIMSGLFGLEDGESKQEEQKDSDEDTKDDSKEEK